MNVTTTPTNAQLRELLDDLSTIESLLGHAQGRLTRLDRPRQPEAWTKQQSAAR